MKCICIPVRERFTLLVQLIESLEPFQRRGWTIVLAIEPGCELINKVYGKRNPVYTLFNTSTYGIGWNHYRVLVHAFNQLQAEIAMVIDADTKLLPDAVNLMEWFYPRRNEYLGLSMLSPKLEDSYPHRDEALIECSFASRFQLTLSREIWYKYVQPVWMRKGYWDEDYSDVIRRTGLKVVHPEKSRLKLYGQTNSRVLNVEEHERIEERLVCFEGDSVRGYYMKDPVIVERR